MLLPAAPASRPHLPCGRRQRGVGEGPGEGGDPRGRDRPSEKGAERCTDRTIDRGRETERRSQNSREVMASQPRERRGGLLLEHAGGTQPGSLSRLLRWNRAGPPNHPPPPSPGTSGDHQSVLYFSGSLVWLGWFFRFHFSLSVHPLMDTDVASVSCPPYVTLP